MAEQNTQIFFTTANGIMINLFKECFKNTKFDYKEYQFVKRVNRPSEIKEIRLNDTKTIEELTLDDLTLDFHQFAAIREILRKNQEKLVAKEDWKIIDKNEFDEVVSQDTIKNDYVEVPSDNFYTKLNKDEISLLNVLVYDDRKSALKLKSALSKYPSYKIMVERINEKAIDFFGETIVDNNYELPWVDFDYVEELKLQNENFAV
jgi:hypothetical protein